MTHYAAGEVVVYVKDKHGLSPGQRAQDVRPAPAGDLYAYRVEKYWIVEAELETEQGPQLRLRTPRGKIHLVQESDPHLRKLTLREWLWLRLADRARWRSLHAKGGESAGGA
jgi:hypothetical protein